MNTATIIKEIDDQILRLQEARALLSQPKEKRAYTKRKQSKKRTVLSKEARDRISAAMKKRWAAKKKSS